MSPLRLLSLLVEEITHVARTQISTMWSFFGLCRARRSSNWDRDIREKIHLTCPIVVGEVSVKILGSSPHLTTSTPSSPRKEVDPISLEEIDEDSCFVFTSPQGKCVRYNTSSIARYFVTSGSLKDPVTRVEWSESDIQRLQSSLAREAEKTREGSGNGTGSEEDDDSARENKGIAKRRTGERERSLINTMKARTVEIEKEEKLNGTVLSLERALGGLISEILKIIEGNSLSLSLSLSLNDDSLLIITHFFL